MSISDPLNAPLFHSSTAVADDNTLARFNAALAGRAYLVDVTGYQRQTLPATTSQFDEGAEVSERSLSREAFWTREQTDWLLGAGQIEFDGDRSSRRRFHTSRGVDPWTPGQLCLLDDTEEVINEETDTNIVMLSVGGLFYWSHGDTLSYVATPGGTATDVVFTETITDFTTDGNQIYVAFGDATPVEAGDVDSSTFAALGVAEADIVEHANGRLVGALGGELFEIDAAGDTDTIRDDSRSGWVWTAIAGLPGQAIFAAGRVGERSELWATTVNDTGALAAATFAGHPPHGETVLALETYAQVVAVGTTAGLRVGLVQNLAVDYGEVIEVGPVRDMAMFDRFCWFTWTDFDGANTGLGRADLSRNTSDATLVPPYASDLMAAAQGNVLAATIHDGDPYFAVAGDGIYGPSGDLVESGFVETGEIRFSVLPPKVFTRVDLHTEPLAGRISGNAIRPSGTEVSLGTITEQQAVEQSLASTQTSGRSVSLRLTLHRDGDDSSDGPCLRAWVLHSLPRPHRITEFTVPIILKTLVTSLQGREVAFSPFNEMRFLDSLASSARLVTFQMGPETHLVRVDSVMIPEGGVRSWQSDNARAQTWFETTVVLRLLSRETRSI